MIGLSTERARVHRDEIKMESKKMRHTFERIPNGADGSLIERAHRDERQVLLTNLYRRCIVVRRRQHSESP